MQDLLTKENGFHGCDDVHFPNDQDMGMDHSGFIGDPIIDFSNEEIVIFEDLVEPTFDAISLDAFKLCFLTIDDHKGIHMGIFVVEVEHTSSLSHTVDCCKHS